MIKEIIEKNNCTWFIPRVSKLDARKKWIIGSVSPKGALIIDNGAIQAIKNEAKSCLEKHEGSQSVEVGANAISNVIYGNIINGNNITLIDTQKPNKELEKENQKLRDQVRKLEIDQDLYKYIMKRRYKLKEELTESQMKHFEQEEFGHLFFRPTQGKAQSPPLLIFCLGQ